MKINNDTNCCCNCIYAKETKEKPTKDLFLKHDLHWCEIEKRNIFFKMGCYNFKLKRGNKYHAKITEINKYKFHSKKEAAFYAELLRRKKSSITDKYGIIDYFLRQPVFDLGEGMVYKADFLVKYNSGAIVIYDVKGKKTKEFIRNKKFIRKIYNIEIKEV